MNIELTIPQLPALQGAWEAAPARTRQVLTRAVRQSTIYVQGVARREEPIDKGRLRSSTGVSVDGLVGRVGGPGLVGYVIYVHEGTGIYARSGNGRRTPWSYRGSDGRWHRTRGNKPNPFMERAARRSEPAVKRFFEQAVNDLLAEVAGGR